MADEAEGGASGAIEEGLDTSGGAGGESAEGEEQRDSFGGFLGAGVGDFEELSAVAAGTAHRFADAKWDAGDGASELVLEVAGDGGSEAEKGEALYGSGVGGLVGDELRGA